MRVKRLSKSLYSSLLLTTLVLGSAGAVGDNSRLRDLTKGGRRAAFLWVDDSEGVMWTAGHRDQDAGEMGKLYQDALIVWCRNRVAKRIVEVTTDGAIEDGIRLEEGGRWAGS